MHYQVSPESNKKVATPPPPHFYINPPPFLAKNFVPPPPPQMMQFSEVPTPHPPFNKGGGSNYEVATGGTNPDMTTVFHTWANDRFKEIQSNLRRKKLNRTN